MKTTRRRLLRATLVALIALTAGLFTALPGFLAPQGYVALAACTKVGKATFDPDGVPRCDCSSDIINSGNCSCLITCPPSGGGGGGDFEIEGGGLS